jgi:hypothetical protein
MAARVRSAARRTNANITGMAAAWITRDNMDIHGIIQMYALVTGHRGHSRGPHGMLDKQLTYALGTGHRGHRPFVPVFNIRNVSAAIHDLELAT